MAENLSSRISKSFEEKIRTGAWPAGEKLPTTRELAAEYGVSINTIQTAFRELEAFTNLVERKPRLGGFVKASAAPKPRPVSTNVAIVVPHDDAAYASKSSDSWTYRIMRSCDRELHGADFHTALFSYDDQACDPVPKLLAKMDGAGARPAGVLCFIREGIISLPSELDRRNIPWVSINRVAEHSVHNFVAQDALFGGRLVGRCVARLGMERVAILTDGMHVGRSNGDMYFGFMQGWLEKHKRSRDVDYVETPSNDAGRGFNAVRQYLEKYGRPDAIFALGDFLAIDGLRALREAGYAPGTDVKVIGGTGLGISTMSDPPLTVSEVPMDRMGEEAARMLLEMSREGVQRMLGRYIPPKLVARQSCEIPPEIIEQETQELLEENWK
jgi:DNA-binding LacI/PurR family transcriptional regulator